MPNFLGSSLFRLLEPLAEPTCPSCPPWAHSLGIIALQQVSRPAVALPANHHQGCKGGQEDGGQHAYGHNHHRLHASGGLAPSPSHPQHGLNLRRHKGRGGLGKEAAKESGAVGVLPAGGAWRASFPQVPCRDQVTCLGGQVPPSHLQRPEGLNRIKMHFMSCPKFAFCLIKSLPPAGPG